MADIPHFDYPFRVGPKSKVCVVEQDTEAHVLTNDNMVIRCPIGFRLERPEYGWPFPEFHPVPLDMAPLEEALRRFGHPNGTADATEYANEADAAVREIQVEVQV